MTAPRSIRLQLRLGDGALERVGDQLRVHLNRVDLIQDDVERFAVRLTYGFRALGETRRQLRRGALGDAIQLREHPVDVGPQRIDPHDDGCHLVLDVVAQVADGVRDRGGLRLTRQLRRFDGRRGDGRDDLQHLQIVPVELSLLLVENLHDTDGATGPILERNGHHALGRKTRFSFDLHVVLRRLVRTVRDLRAPGSEDRAGKTRGRVDRLARQLLRLLADDVTEDEQSSSARWRKIVPATAPTACKETVRMSRRRSSRSSEDESSRLMT